MGTSEKSHVKGLERVEIDTRLEVHQDNDAEFGGTEARKNLERKLLWKLDLRMSVLVVIYILNYVSRARSTQSPVLTI